MTGFYRGGAVDHDFVFHHLKACNAKGNCLKHGPDGNAYRKQTASLLLTATVIASSVQQSWSTLFALTDTGLLRKDWVCVRSRRAGGSLAGLWVLTPNQVDLDLCPIAELEEPWEKEWWRAWVADQMRRIDEFQMSSANSSRSFGVVQTTSRRDANYRWVYVKKNGQIVNAASGECLDASADGTKAVPRPCLVGSLSQTWHFSHHA